MAGYPYTGGIYGGYSDPSNNKKKTVVGPDADKAISSIARQALNQTPPESFSAEAGANSTILPQKTPKGYPNIGFSSPPAPLTILNVPGDSGVSPSSPVAQASPVASTARSMLTSPGMLKSHALPGGAMPVPANRPPAQTIKDGWTSNTDSSVFGGRKLSFGTPGTDNSGIGYVSGPARQMSARSASPGMVQGANGPYSVTGDPAAVSAFSRPVTPAVGWDGNTKASEPLGYKQLRDRQESQAMEVPQYMGKESGIGRGARLEIYKQQMEAYNRAMGNNAQLNIEQMREAGAGRRSLEQAAQANTQNDIARQRLGLEKNEFDAKQPLTQAQLENQQMQLGFSKDEAAARKQLAGLKPGTPEYAEAERRYASLTGKFGEQKQPNVMTIDQNDPNNPMGSTKVPIRINPDGTYTKMQESGSQQQAPQAALEYLKKNPNQAEAFKKKYGYLPEGY